VPHPAVPIPCALFFAAEPRNTFPLNHFRTLLRAMEGVPPLLAATRSTRKRAKGHS